MLEELYLGCAFLVLLFCQNNTCKTYLVCTAFTYKLTNFLFVARQIVETSKAREILDIVSHIEYLNTVKI